MSQTSPVSARDDLQAHYNDLLELQDQTDQVPLEKALDAVGLALSLLGHAQTPAVTVTDDELFNLAAAAWETQTSHPWYTDALEAAVYAVRERLTVSDTSTDRPDTRPDGNSK